MIIISTVANKIEAAKKQTLVKGVDVVVDANPKRMDLVRGRAETENESQSVHALQKVLVAQSCVRVSTVATLFAHVLALEHPTHKESVSENSFLHIKESEGKTSWNWKMRQLIWGLGEF